jgi:hypothetical protein
MDGNQELVGRKNLPPLQEIWEYFLKREQMTFHSQAE